MLRIFGKKKLFLKNANVIESLASVNTIVFDKTGTITQNNSSSVMYEGMQLTDIEKSIIKFTTRQSAHPLSKVIEASLHGDFHDSYSIGNFKENAGNGIEAIVNNRQVKIG